MMIQIERLNGPQAGRTTTHAMDERVTFGRSADNAVRLAGRHLSRHHGEIVCHAGQWRLSCASNNPLTVNGRTVAGGQTRELAPGQTVSLDGEPLFCIELLDDGQTAGMEAYDGRSGSAANVASCDDPSTPPLLGASTAEGGEGEEGGAGSRRSRIWIGIGVYLLVLAGAFGVLSGLSSQRQASVTMPPQLADEAIAAEIREPLRRVPSEREAARHLAEAQRWYARGESSPDAVFLAHYHYKLARAYAGLDRAAPLEDGLDQLRYRELEQRLIRRMQREYRQAFALAHNREWRAAERALRSLLLSYTPPADQPSPLVANVEQQLRVVTRSQPSQSFR